MNADRLKQIYELYGVDKLIEIMLKKDDMVEGLQKRLEGLHYVGRLYIGDKNYSFYFKEDT